MENLTASHAEIFTSTYRIEKAIMDCHKQTKEGLSPEAQDAFQNVIAEIYEMRRTLKPLMSEDNKATVARLKRERD